MNELKAYRVWDANVRWFHWINVLCVFGLIAVGVAILNDDALGLSSEGKILLKTVHVLIGYVLALNLLWRLIWAFIGGEHSRWQAILPGGRGYMAELRAYVTGVKAGRSQQYLGHNPLGRIAVTVLLLMLLVMAVSGLVLAGTDLFYPPIGSWIAGWVAAHGVDPASLQPYAKDTYDAAAYADMRAFRKPFITVHEFGFYLLLGLIVIHILAVVITELRDGGNLISAMFIGKKVLDQEPSDKTNFD